MRRAGASDEGEEYPVISIQFSVTKAEPSRAELSALRQKLKAEISNKPRGADGHVRGCLG